MPQNQCVESQSAFAACNLPSQTELVIIPTNIWPVKAESIVWFSHRGLSHKEMLRIIGVSKHAYVMFVWRTVLPQGYVCIAWRRSHQKKIVPYPVSQGGTGFSQCTVSCWGELDAISVGKGRSSSGYRSRHSDRFPRLTLDHRQRCHMLTHRHLSGTIWTGLIWYLLM